MRKMIKRYNIHTNMFEVGYWISNTCFEIVYTLPVAMAA